MRAIDLFESFRQAVRVHPHLPVVVRGIDDSGNEVDVKLKGVVTVGTDQWGPVLVLK